LTPRTPVRIRNQSAKSGNYMAELKFDQQSSLAPALARGGGKTRKICRKTPAFKLH
jgi:hypothetical protein